MPFLRHQSKWRSAGGGSPLANWLNRVIFNVPNEESAYHRQSARGDRRPGNRSRLEPDRSPPRGGACHQGPNDSGKSTLAKVLAGHPDYHVKKGEVFMDGENILALEPDERAQF